MRMNFIYLCLISFRLCESPNECRNILSSSRIIYFYLRIINYTILSNIIRISLHIMPILYKKFYRRNIISTQHIIQISLYHNFYHRQLNINYRQLNKNTPSQHSINPI